MHLETVKTKRRVCEKVAEDLPAKQSNDSGNEASSEDSMDSNSLKTRNGVKTKSMSNRKLFVNDFNKLSFLQNATLVGRMAWT